MARAYSDDLRRKLLEAHQAGEGTLSELARRFRVSWAWARKISAAMGRTGGMERPPGAGGGGGVFGGAGRKPAGPHPGEAPGGLGAGLGDRGRGDATVDCAEANGTAF